MPFNFQLQVDGQLFEGSGASKKLAKQACARSALTKLYNLSFTPIIRVTDGSGFTEAVNGAGQELVPGGLVLPLHDS